MTKEFTFPDFEYQSHVFTHLFDHVYVCGHFRLSLTHGQVIKVAKCQAGSKTGEKWFNGHAKQQKSK
jgi:hypothetical protein